MTAPNAIPVVDFLAKLAATLLGLFCLVFALLTRGGRDELLEDQPPIEPDDVQRQRALRLVNDTTPDERRRNATNN